MTSPEDFVMSPEEKNASLEHTLEFTVDDTVRVNADTADAALLWQVVEVKEVSGYYILRAIGDPDGNLRAFKASEVSEAVNTHDAQKVTFPKLKAISEDESNSLIMSSQIEEFINGLEKSPERASEAANEAIEDLGEKAVEEVVAGVEGNSEELQKIEASVNKALVQASEVFKDKYRIDEELRGLLEMLGRDMNDIRSLATASSPQLFQQLAREFTEGRDGREGRLGETAKKFGLFSKDSLGAIENTVINVNMHIKAAEQHGETYDDLKPLTVGIQMPVTIAENKTLSIAYMLRKTNEDIQQLINKSFRGPVEPSELMHIAAVYEEYSSANPAIADMLSGLKRSVQEAAKALESRI